MLSVHVAVPETVAVSETVPVKPFSGEMVIVEVVGVFARTGFGEAEPAAIEKS